MQKISPLLCYQQTLSQGDYRPDDVQRDAITRLDAIWQQFTAQKPEQPAEGLRARLIKLLDKKKPPAAQQPIQGLYMWGGVGRGKTWLMDMFFQTLPGDRKLRLHFHRFMLRVHEELAQLQGQSDPLEIVADRFKAETDILCFDEFFVSDITDAMLLGTLMNALFARGISLVATSNIPPDDLYHNGLQRTRFLPAIASIKQHCEVMNVDAGIDYRLRTLTQANIWLSPLNADTEQQMKKLYMTLSGVPLSPGATIEINHRPLATLGMANQTLAVAYSKLCVEARSQHDYIALSRQFHTVMLFHVQQMNASNENEARRFIALVDEFYERHVKLLVSAQTELLSIYQGETLKFEFQRCLSRLQEMQSEEYLRLEHMP